MKEHFSVYHQTLLFAKALRLCVKIFLFEVKPMKKKTKPAIDDDLRPHYDLWPLLPKGVLGKYAERYREGANHVTELSSAGAKISSVKLGDFGGTQRQSFSTEARRSYQVSPKKS